MIKNLLLIAFLFSLFSCSTTKLLMETNKIYSFKIKPQPIINSADLSPREYRFLEQIADTMKKDSQILLNIVSYREDGYYDTKTHEHCVATEQAKDYILEQGIESKRISHFFGKALLI